VIAILLDAASWVLILSGSFFVVVSAIGLIRMPELFTRMHAASVSDTLGAGLLLAGMMLQIEFGLTTLKLAFIFVLILFTSPVVTHALAQAALHEKILPSLAEDRRTRRDGDPNGRQQ